MLKFFIISIAAVLCCNAFSQSFDNNWIFGDSVGLDFTADFPVYFKTSINSHEASASISDSVGGLLFYTNGQTVWNKLNEVMPNGSELEIGKIGTAEHSSITQGVAIVPNPASSSLFYIFYILDNTLLSQDGLAYSTVDLNLDDGLGEVVEKNVQIYTNQLTEKMQVVKHGNGQDWWLLLRSRPESEDDTLMCFIRYLITFDGIAGPYSQCYGPGDNFNGSDNAGQMKFSPDGNQLAYVNKDRFYLYDFDRCTGEVSNFRNTIVFEDPGFELLYGCEFSADSRMLYLTSSENHSLLLQYCLACADPIEETKDTIYRDTFSDYSLGQLQLGSDGKIYVPISHDYYNYNIYSEINQNMSVINNPNADGLSCDFDTLTISLGDGRCTLTLPNMPNYELGALIGSGCDTITAIQNSLSPQIETSIYPNPANTFIIITSQLDDYKNVAVSIYTIAGVKIKEIRLTSDDTQKIDIAELQQGLYTLLISDGNDYFYRDKLLIIK